MQSVLDELDAMWSESTGRSQGPWTREGCRRAKSCMSGREFIDTDVLICADDVRNPQKRRRARESIRDLMRQMSRARRFGTIEGSRQRLPRTGPPVIA